MIKVEKNYMFSDVFTAIHHGGGGLNGTFITGVKPSALTGSCSPDKLSSKSDGPKNRKHQTGPCQKRGHRPARGGEPGGDRLLHLANPAETGKPEA